MHVFTSQHCLEMEHNIATVNSTKYIAEMCFCVLYVHVVYDGNIDDNMKMMFNVYFTTYCKLTKL